MARLRYEILTLLAGHPGEYLSGEKISRQLQVTRAAVWKQIKILQEEGFAIAGQTKRGYCLLHTPLALNEWVLAKKLAAACLKNRVYLEDELESTNARAKELVQQEGFQGQVVLAKRQNSGRGRLQRQWEAPPGGLWMSVVLQPKLSLADAAKITLAASVAVADALEELFSLRVGIKWPNDLLFNDLKLVGILGEVGGEWNTVQNLILGIGINANFPRSSLSPFLKATTLYEILGQEVNLNSLAVAILGQLAKQVRALEDNDFEGLRSRWLEKAVGLGQEVTVWQEGQAIQGVLKGITLDGTLLLETGKGEISFAAGEIQW